MKKSLFVLYILLSLFTPGMIFSQHHPYDFEKELHDLKDISQLVMKTKNSLLKNINSAIMKNDTSAILRIIRADSSNVIPLFKISSKIKPKYSQSTNATLDQISFREILDEVVIDYGFQYWAYIYYFNYLFNKKTEAVDFIISAYDSEYYSWFPFYMDNFQGFLLLFRHIINHHFPDEQSAYSDKWRDLVFFMYIRFNDISICEIKNLNYEPNSIKQIQNEPNINIINSQISLFSSSELSKKYKVSNLLDYDLNTVWAEGVVGDGSNETIDIALNTKEYIENLVLFPGHSKNKKLFIANNRIKELEITINGRKINHKIKDKFVPVVIPIKKIISKLNLKIISVYRGTKYNDLCIGEIMLTKNK